MSWRVITWLWVGVMVWSVLFIGFDYHYGITWGLVVMAAMFGFSFSQLLLARRSARRQRETREWLSVIERWDRRHMN